MFNLQGLCLPDFHATKRIDIPVFPSIFLIVSALQESRVDLVLEISEREADETMRALAKVEGIFSGQSLDPNA